MRVLLAVDHEPTERALSSAGHRVEVAQYREAVPALLDRFAPEAVVLSCDLPGSAPLEDLVWQARLSGARVVLLAGRRPKSDPVLEAAFRMGVYDILFDPASPQDVLAALSSPASFADAARLLGMRVPERKAVEKRGPRVLGVWSPVSAGKTFCAVNLAAVLALRGERVLLAGLDGSGDRPVWLGLDGSPEPREVPSVPGLLVAELSGSRLALEAAESSGASVVVLDPADPSVEGARLLGVCDPDYARLLRVKRGLGSLGVSPALVVNRWVSLPGVPVDPSAVLGVRVAASLPDDPRSVLSSVAEGVPLAVSSPEWR
ncbi:MAG: hypothetical protein AB1816_17825, partial [Bacillota bacterium]